MSNKIVTRIPNGELAKENKNNGVFIALYTVLNGKLFALMVNRARGDIGFPGGKIGEGETIGEALEREIREETGSNIIIELKEKLLCSHKFPMGDSDMFHSHFYTMEVEFNEIHEIISNFAASSDAFPSEITGLFLAPIHETKKGQGFNFLIQNKLASSVKEELLLFAKEHNPKLVKDIDFATSSLSSISLKDKEKLSEGKIIETSEKNFRNLISEGISIVDFWAPWCGPCRLLAPVFEDLSREFKGSVKFLKLNTDENMDLAVEEKVRSIPTLKIYKDGVPFDEKVGAMNIKSLRTWIEDTKKRALK